MALKRTAIPLWVLAAVAAAAPAPEPVPHPMITPAPVLRRGLERRVEVGSYIDSLISKAGSGVSSYVASGIPQYFQDFPVGGDVESTLGINDDDLKATPTQVLNVPGYANWTEQGWNVRVHGNVFKQPNISQDTVDDLANKFLIGTSIADLPTDQQNQARNLTREIFVVQQRDLNVTINFVNDVAVEPDASGGVINAEGGSQSIQLPYQTTDEGDFDTFVVLANTTGENGGHLIAGNTTSSIQSLNMYANGTTTGNATAYLVPPEGLTIISDIDDILRVTKIYDPAEGLLNSFARAFTQWENMPEIYANWSASIPNFHFHYLTTTPEQVTRNYMETPRLGFAQRVPELTLYRFIYKTYPLGSFDTRPLNFSDVSATLQIRRFLLDKIFQTFPQRKFVLMGDTTNADVMKAYPALAKDYPGQVQCIFLRNTSATDSTDLFPYDTSGFEGLNQSQYMFFINSNDLTNLDIVGGNCYNSSIPQNVTFGYQGYGFGNAATPLAFSGSSIAALVAFWFAFGLFSL
ncbi:putative Phosphatidate phosphatase APP1 catalytic domain-containing protein [Seiridium cardinale]